MNPSFHYLTFNHQIRQMSTQNLIKALFARQMGSNSQMKEWIKSGEMYSCVGRDMDEDRLICKYCIENHPVILCKPPRPELLYILEPDVDLDEFEKNCEEENHHPCMSCNVCESFLTKRETFRCELIGCGFFTCMGDCKKYLSSIKTCCHGRELQCEDRGRKCHKTVVSACPECVRRVKGIGQNRDELGD